MAAALAAIHTFLRFQERATNHRRASADFGNIRREIEQLLAGNCDDDERNRIDEALDKIRLAINDADSSSPDVPKSIWKQTAEGLKDSRPPPMQE